MTIGERIKLLREDKNLTQTELAEAIGTTKQNIYKYENGIITNIPSDKIEQIALFFHVSPAYIMGWDEEKWRIDPELNSGYPIPPGPHYARMKDRNLILEQKRKQAIDKVVPIPSLNIDEISKFVFDESINSYYDFAPLAFFYKKNGNYIYVENKSKHDEFKDRMYPLIEENDIILLDFGAEAQNGDIAMIEFLPAKKFFCRFYKYDDFIEFQFTSHKPIRIDRNDKCYSKYEVIGVVKQIIKNL